ncbi:MAG: HlyD family efflux transporter periplasmic adaptor subunit [Luteolibacter sp.]
MASSSPESPSGSAPWEAKQNPSGKKRLRRLLPWIGGALLILLILRGLWPKPVIVETAIVKEGPLTVRVSEEGKTRIRDRYVIASPATGTMRRVSLKPGDPVVAGETVISTIEPAASPLLDPRAREQAEAVVSLREAARSQARQALEAARAAANQAAADRDRVLAVGNPRAISAAERDQAVNEAAIKEAQLRSGDFALKVTEYELSQARASLERGSSSGAETVPIKSPVSGQVLKVMQESETVIASGAPILEVGDPKNIEIEAEILSRDAVGIRPGDSVAVEQWGGEATLKARVRRVEPAAFTKVSSLGVEEQRVIVLSDLVEIPQSAATLGDRYRVEVRVATWHSDKVLALPAGALFREGNLWKTFVMRGGKAVLATVEAGHSDGRTTEVISGLSAGDEVLLHPPDTVKDGTAVKKRD